MCDLTRGRCMVLVEIRIWAYGDRDTYNLESLDYCGIVVKRLAIGPLGQFHNC